CHVELRPDARLVRAVTVEQARRGAVGARSPAVGDRDGHLRAVWRGRGDALRDVPRRVVTGYLPPFAQCPAAAGQVHVVPGLPGSRAGRAGGRMRDGGRTVAAAGW